MAFQLSELTNRLKAGFGTLAISCPVGSERKLEAMLVQFANASNPRRKPVIWDAASHLQELRPQGDGYTKVSLTIPTPAMAKPGELPICGLFRYLLHLCDPAHDPTAALPPHLFIVYDLPPFLRPEPQYAAITRFLKNVCAALNLSKHRMILIHDGSTGFGDAFQDLIAELSYPIPNEQETEILVRQQLEELETSARTQRLQLPNNLSDPDFKRTVRSLLGLTEEGQINLLQFAVRELRALDDRLPGMLNTLKQQQLKNIGIEYAPSPDVAAQGLAALDDWVNLANAALDPRAKDFNIPTPRGLMLIGPPGTGKSLITKNVSAQLGIPCLVLDFSKLMSKGLGDSEHNLRKVFQAAGHLAPCFLMIDELDKAFSNAAAEGDGGTSSRMMATLLTWLNDHQEAVIPIVTANRPWGFSPELMRRFTRMFVDAPTWSARKQIFKVHLQLRKLLPNPIPTRGKVDAQLEELTHETQDYTGDEIGTICSRVATQIFLDLLGDEEGLPENGLLPYSHELMISEIRNTPPQLRADYQERDRLIAWVRQGNATYANPPEPEPARTTSRRK